MNMKKYSGPVLCFAMVALSGCSGTSSPSETFSLNKTVITGMASKGPINKGTVKVFAVREGIVDLAPLNQGETDADGNFSIDVGSFKGPVMVEVAGSFKDEVSTETVTLAPQNPLRAVFSNASTNALTGKKNTVAVTPLTGLAFKKAKQQAKLKDGKLTKLVIDEANKAMAVKFKLADIVSTLPVAGGTKAGEKEYAAACGTISQLANNNRSLTSGKKLDVALTDVMSKMESEIEQNGELSPESETDLNKSIDDFNTGGKNKSGAEATHVETHVSGGI